MTVKRTDAGAYGIRDADSRNAIAQPGRIGSGTSIFASSSAASTALLPTGRSTPAQIVRVATSTAILWPRLTIDHCGVGGVGVPSETKSCVPMLFRARC